MRLAPTSAASPEFDLARVAAISFDLDDTLWSFAEAVERAEGVLHAWLLQHAPKTVDVLSTPSDLAALRAAAARAMVRPTPDLSALRRESIRTALLLADEDLRLVEPAYAAFLEERQRVKLYVDVLPALRALSNRFSLVAVSNGNSDLQCAGVRRFFQADLKAAVFGSAKPDAAIFHAAAAAVGCEPAQLLHVGDDPVMDVQGAMNAGLQAAWLQRYDEIAKLTAPLGNSANPPQLLVQTLGQLCAHLDCH